MTNPSPAFAHGRRRALAVLSAAGAIAVLAFAATPASAAPAVNTTPPELTGQGIAGTRLTCNPGVWTQTNVIGNYQFRWLRDGVLFLGPSMYQTKYVTVASDAGTEIVCRVSRQNKNGTSGQVSSNPVEISGPLLPENTEEPELTGSGAVGDKLKCDPGTWTETGAFTFQWLNDGVPFVNPSAYPKGYIVQQADVGDDISCRVTRTNSRGTSDPATSNAIEAVPAGFPPENITPPLLNGSGLLGDTLICGTGTWDSKGVYSYAWAKNNVVFAAPNSPTYVPVSGDIGSLMTCQVTRTNSFGASDPATSNAILIQ